MRFFFSKSLTFLPHVVQFQLIQNAQTTNKLIRALLTTTPSYSHISNFRHQPRTDSRADKPDTFPGFDLTDEATPSPRKRRRQAYSQLLRMFIEKTRERLETIRDVVKDERGLHFQLIHPDEGDYTDGNRPNSQLRALDFEGSGSSEVIDFRGNGAIQSDIVIESNGASQVDNNPNLPQKYFSSLLTAIGFKRIPKKPVNKSAKQMNAENSSVLTTYLLNPILNIWHRARDRLNFNSNYRQIDNKQNDMEKNPFAKITLNSSVNNTATKLNSNAKSARNDTNDVQQPIVIDEGVVLVETMIITTKTPTSLSSNDKSKSLPFKLSANISTSNNKDDDDNDDDYVDGNINIDEMNSTENNNNNQTNANTNETSAFNDVIQNADSSVQKAATAFQNAFLKYANYNPSNVMKTNATNGSETFEQLNALPNGLLDGFLNDQMSNIQVIPLENYGNHSMHSSNDVQSTSIETAGIYVLEIFGTVIGLAWGAFGQIQNWLDNSGNNKSSN